MNLLFTILATLAAVFSIAAFMINQYLHQEASRKLYAKFLQTHIFKDLYQEHLSQGLKILDRLFGKTVFGIQALGVSFTLSFFYSFLLFILVWMIGGRGNLGKTEIVPEDWEIWQRILGIVVILVGFACTYFLYHMLARWVEKWQKKDIPLWWVNGGLYVVASILTLITGIYANKSWRWIISGLLFFLFIYFLKKLKDKLLIFFLLLPLVEIGGMGIGVLGGVGVIGIIGVGIIGVAGVGIGGLIIGVAGIIEIGIGVGIALGLWLGLLEWVQLGQDQLGIRFVGTIGDLLGILYVSEGAILLFIFFALLPLVNGLLDYISWAISRTLARNILLKRKFLIVAIHLLLDIIVAVGLLIGLIFFLAFGLEFLNQILLIRTNTPIDVLRLIAETRNNPFGVEGFWVACMILSTLIPTLLHFTIAFLGLLTVHFTTENHRKRLSQYLGQSVQAKWNLPVLHFSFFFTLSFAAVLFGVWLIALGIGVAVQPLADSLYDLAIWSYQLAL